MATPSSGTISLNDVQTEFRGSNPIAINEYYKADLGVPTSGAISLNDLRGKTRHATKTEIANWFSSTDGVYRRTRTVGSGTVWSQIGRSNDGDIGTFTATFTPINLVDTNGFAVNLKKCVENTVVWYDMGDDRRQTASTAAMSSFLVNGASVTPTFNSRAYVRLRDADSLTQFAVSYTSSTAPFTDIASATATHPSGGTDTQQTGGAFIIPGKWNATTNFAGHQTGATSVTLDHGDILLVGWHTEGDPDGDTPFNLSVNQPLLNTNTAFNILPNYCEGIRWHNCSGIWIYTNTSGVTRTYTMPNTVFWATATRSYYKHAVTLKFAPDQYYGQQS
jgi:hypothetical protein